MRDGEPAGKSGGDGEAFEIVVVIHPLFVAAAVRARVGDVGFDRALVGFNRARVLAGARVDVRRHVQQMSDRRHHRFEALRARPRALGLTRSLDRVDVVVVRADVLGPPFQRLLEHGDELDMLLRAAWPQRQQAVGIEDRGIRVVGPSLEELAGVDGVPRCAVEGEPGAIARRQRLRVGALVGFARHGFRAARRRAPGFDLVARRIAVEIRAGGEGETNQRHGRGRVEPRGFEE
jgi:hypothetical protein